MTMKIDQTPKNKEMTVKQYEFYKRKGLSDEKIMAMHGIHTVAMNKWKKENNLIGVKFEPEVKVSQHVTVSPFAGMPSPSSSVDSKTPTITQAEVMERHNSLNNAQEVSKTPPTDNTEPILVSDLQRLGESIDDDLAKRVDLDKFQHEENQEYIAELLDEVADKAQKIEEERENAKGWERKYYEELGRGDSWRNKCQDAERKIEKLKEELGVETANRKYADKLTNEALTTAYQDEQLAVMLAAKFVDVSKRNLEGN